MKPRRTSTALQALLDGGGPRLQGEPAPGARHGLLQPHRVRVGHRPASARSRPSPAAGATTGSSSSSAASPRRPAASASASSACCSRCRPSASPRRRSLTPSWCTRARPARARRGELSEKLRDAGLAVVLGNGGSFKSQMKKADASRRALRGDPRRRRGRGRHGHAEAPSRRADDEQQDAIAPRAARLAHVHHPERRKRHHGRIVRSRGTGTHRRAEGLVGRQPLVRDRRRRRRARRPSAAGRAGSTGRRARPRTPRRCSSRCPKAAKAKDAKKIDEAAPRR